MTDLCAPIGTVVENVCATMLGLTVKASSEGTMEFVEPLTGAVYYAGVWKGALAIECSTGQAKRWAAAFMPLSEPATDEDARDGLAEVANMIAGNLKALLPPGVSLSIPSVVEGSDHRLRIFGARTEAHVFDDGIERFRVRLVMEE